MIMRNKRFACYFWFVGWDCISLGGHICLRNPNIEIHLPFGFVRIGWELSYGRRPRWGRMVVGRGLGIGYIV